MEYIIRGTTPSFIVRLNGTGITVADVENAVLTIVRKTETQKLYLDDLSIDPEQNMLYYHFSQEETLALRNGESLYFEMDILANGERYRAVSETHQVKNTAHPEVLEEVSNNG